MKPDRRGLRGAAWALSTALVLAAGPAPAQVPAQAPASGTDPAALRAEIAQVRRNTDWSDPEAVRAANARIQQLMRQLEQGRLRREAAAGAARGETAPAAGGADAAPRIDRASVREDVQAAAQAGGGTLLLGERVREQVVAELAEAHDPRPDNPAYLAALPWLSIDFSQPDAPLRVALLQRATGVRHLLLSGGARRAGVDLPAVLAQAAHLPLESLVIVGFGVHLRALPDAVGTYAGLQRLVLVDNALAGLPPALARLQRLQLLHLDLNAPLRGVLPVVQQLPALRELGLARTAVPAAERAAIAAALPQCQVLER